MVIPFEDTYSIILLVFFFFPIHFRYLYYLNFLSEFSKAILKEEDPLNFSISSAMCIRIAHLDICFILIRKLLLCFLYYLLHGVHYAIKASSVLFVVIVADIILLLLLFTSFLLPSICVACFTIPKWL